MIIWALPSGGRYESAHRSEDVDNIQACGSSVAIIAAASAIFLASSPLDAADRNYHLVKKVVLGGKDLGTISPAIAPLAVSTSRAART